MNRVIRLGAVSVALLAVGCATDQTQQTAGRPTTPVVSPTSLPTAPATAAEELDDGSTRPPPTNSTLAADPASRQVAAAAATKAMRLFARRDVDATTWWSDLVPLLSAKAAQDYRHVDPANVPPTKLTGPAKALAQETPSVARVSVPTDAGVYLVVLSRTSDDPRWVVERITPPESSGD